MPLAAFPKCFLDELSLHKTMSVEQWVNLAADNLDIDGLELYWGFTPQRDVVSLARIRDLALSRGLTIPMMCYSPDFTKPDAAERALEIEKQKDAIACTSIL